MVEEAKFEDELIRKKRRMMLFTCLGFALAFLSIGIYAFFSDMVQVSNRIELQQDGVARVHIAVDYKKGEETEERKLLEIAKPESAAAVRGGLFATAGYMNANYKENKMTINQGEDKENHLDFSHANKYTYGAYRITLTNSHACDAVYTIRVMNAAGKADFESEGVAAYFAEGAADLSAGITAADEAELKKGESKTVYVAIGLKDELDEINGRTLHGYTLKIAVKEKTED